MTTVLERTPATADKADVVRDGRGLTDSSVFRRFYASMTGFFDKP